MTFRHTRYRRRSVRSGGFSLLQTSVLLMMAAMVLVSLMPGQNAGDNNQKLLDTVAKLNKVEDGMERFMAQNGRRPCPADGQYDVDNANFGWEAGHTIANTPLPGCTGGAPVAPLGPDNGTHLIVGGMIPTKTLGLPDDYAYDAWGRRMTYEVDVRATTASTCFALKTGSLQVKTKDPTGAVTFTDNVMYAYLTHGPSGYGAWPAQGSTMANRINTGIADADKQNNAGVNAAFLYNKTNFTNALIAKDRTAQFDDVVYYLDAFKNTCCIGQSCNNAAGFQPTGQNAGDNTGTKVITLDINGDGLTDIAICAPNASPGGKTGAGSVYVVFGSKTTFYSSSLPLSGLTGTNGFRIDGANNGDHLCSSLASGDVNGDGIRDLIIGASSANSGTGAVYVVMGGTGSWPASFSVSALNGSSGGANGANGWVIKGENANDKFGAAVTSKDFNGDDFDDILIGAPGASSNDGAAYLICGGGGPWSASINASGLTGIPGSVPTCGIKITSPSGMAEQFGTATAMGNLYGDNYADALIGAPYGNVGSENAAGKVYALCGGTGTYSTPLAASGVTGIPGAAGTCGTVFDGVDHDHHAGSAIGVADVNGDGIQDIIIGAPNSNALGRVNAGSTYVIYGNSTGFGATFNLNNITYNTNGFRIDGLAGDNAGTAVYGGCDTNGDGIQDVIIGAPHSSPLSRAGAGSTYIIFGGTVASSLIDVGTLNGTNGVAIYGASAGDASGSSVATGDFYNFGLCNIVIGAPNATVGGNANAGTVYTVLGMYNWPATFDLSTLR